MKRILFAAAVLIFLTAGCASPRATGGNSPSASKGVNSTVASNEVKYYPTYDSKYKTARNDIFDFWFDIPAGWKAVDKASDGKVFTILPDNGNVELKVSGIDRQGSDDEYYKKLAGDKGKIEDFSFVDGWVGKKITNPDSGIYYLRIDGDSYICFYIGCGENSDWYAANADKLDHIAASLRTRQGTLGNAGSENKITMDDLQLGDVNLDMPYGQLSEAMKSKLSKTEDYVNCGIDGQILFYEDKTEIYIADGYVNSIDVISGNYATPRGLKVGDSTDRLEELYGKPDNINDANHWGYTYNGYELLSIVIKDDKVAEIEMDLTM